MSIFRSRNDSTRRTPVGSLATLRRGDYAELRIVELADGSARVELWNDDNPDRPGVFVTIRQDEVEAVADALAALASAVNPKRTRGAR